MLQGQPLNNSIALVTGASRGIGSAIALELGKHGATVIGTATSASGAEQVTQSLQQAGIKGVGLALDVNDAAQIESVLKAIREQFGDVSVLVNNAGVFTLTRKARDLTLPAQCTGTMSASGKATRV